MKIMLEITGLTSGQSARGAWLRLSGRDQNGRGVSAVCFEQLADTISRTVAKMVPEGEDIAPQRLLVDLAGQFRDGKQIVRDGKPVTRADGTPVLSRAFFIESFRFLTGPTLEIARMRRDASARLTKAEDLRQTEDIKGAYRVLGEFVASLCARPFDLISNDAALDDDDEEFGYVADAAGADARTAPVVESPPTAAASEAVPADDPEASAAAIFAREDAVSDASFKGERKLSLTERQPGNDVDVLDDAPLASRTPAREGADASAPAKEQASATTAAERVEGAVPAPRMRTRLGGRRFAI